MQLSWEGMWQGYLFSIKDVRKGYLSIKNRKLFAVLRWSIYFEKIWECLKLKDLQNPKLKWNVIIFLFASFFPYRIVVHQVLVQTTLLASAWRQQVSSVCVLRDFSGWTARSSSWKVGLKYKKWINLKINVMKYWAQIVKLKRRNLVSPSSFD